MAASITLYVKKDSKKRNSTKQVEFTESFLCDLKEATSVDNPTFILAADSFNYNLAKWDDRYYFIDNVVSVRRGLWEVSCVLDVLATYKTEILASTQFVSYSSHNPSIWLPDTRIPVRKDAVIGSAGSNVPLIDSDGFLVLTAVGKNGCSTYMLQPSNIMALLDQLNQWSDDSILEILTGGSYDFSTVEKAIKSLSEISTRTGFLGNAWSDAPNCIRSCVWVPFKRGLFADNSSAGRPLTLGQFETNVYCSRVKTGAVLAQFSLSIPWHYSDWRRAECEDVYIYLPLVGIVQLSSDSLTSSDSISVLASATATDGVIAYELKAGSQVIGTYGGQCSANYPIGISQQASAGALAQTAFAGVEKTVNAAVNSSISPLSMVGAAAGSLLSGIDTAYQVENLKATRHNTCIGGIGGGAGSGLDFSAICFTVAHSTNVAPSEMLETMGLPTMAPMSLATLTGYCQCANAHVSAPAQASELDAIDRYLNGGFFIE